MDPESESELGCICGSPSDCTECHPYVCLAFRTILLAHSQHLRSSTAIFPQAWQAGGLTRDAKLLVKSFTFSPSFLGARVIEDRTAGTNRRHTPKYSETIGMQAVDRVVTNYNYYISGGVGGPGGGARDQGTGGGGGAGHGPTVYLGQPPEETTSRDLDLLKEIRLEEQSRVVDRPSRGASVRRMYSANFVVRESERKVTVAMYQGDGAEDEWRQDFAKYESIRHPNILQLYGIVNAKKLCAMVFHDELVPYDQFLSRFEHSPILTIYILSYCITEWWEAMDYYDSILRESDLAAVI
ncbi:hypothetical protein MSAN_02272000 [Mycena sanguinolenta]|uniref:Uncharacterized protein n=1 Tax=Mycena sanguinolenta TaxID=230812 RepID=A0A8H7CIH5_9AGAR|nr:hypothetical protein MSAN_02272000 [Mycena sanguinolenta]